MLKILSQFISFVSKVFLKITSFLGKNLWLIFFKKILVPFYKVFLFIRKTLTQAFFGSPNTDTLTTAPKTFYQKYFIHLIIFFIFLFVVLNNFTTRHTYAEEFGKKSIIADLFISNGAEEIIERPLLNIKDRRPVISETINGQLSALDSSPAAVSGYLENLAFVSQTGEALINPHPSPFIENSSPASLPNYAIKKYEVQSGDTLSTIATKFNLSINTLLWENNLTLKSSLRPGTLLSILPVDGLSYSVKRGDTIGGIARKFNVGSDKILTYNNLDPNANIKINQKLIIPNAKPLANQNTTIPPQTQTTNVFTKSNVGNGQYIWPSTSRRITQYFSWRHQAIDIGAKAGTPIYALAAGRVELAGWSTGYGYNIVIDHGNGVRSRYAHSRKLYVKAGDQVSAGEVLGEVGSTGNSTGPHIHLEFIIRGTKVNPLGYL